jgi:hypothetical protein
MRFFTKEWLRGELTDAAFKAAPAAYRHHLTTQRFPPDVLLLSDVDIHDGLLLDMKHEPASAQLMLQLRCGDLQRGYFDLHIQYSGVTRDSESLSVLHFAMQDPKDEFLYDELDRAGDRFEHRCILSSHREVCIAFTTVEVKSQPVGCRTAI